MESGGDVMNMTSARSHLTSLNLSEVFAALDDIDAFREQAAEDLDSAWNLLCFMLVFLMQSGFAYLEAGGVRSSSVVNVTLKNLVDAAAGALLWYLVGWGLTREEGANFWGGFAGNSGFAERGGDSWALSYAYSVTTVTIVSGAVAERITMPAYVAQVILMLGFVVPVCFYWVWSPLGWLSAGKAGGAGFLDFAGGLVVHGAGGLWAFLTAWILGPRLLGAGDCFTPDGRAELAGQNKFFTCVGTLILAVCWLAFNSSGAGGVTGAANGVSSHAIAVTVLGASGGVLGGLWLSYEVYGYPGLEQVCCATLAAMVSVTAGCAYVPVWAGLPIGLIGSGAYFAWHWVLPLMRVDDAIGASSVHLVPGLWGTIAVGLFADQDRVREITGAQDARAGLLLSGSPEQLWVQLLGAASVLGLVAVCCLALNAVLRAMDWLRLPEEAEYLGIDLFLHNEVTYDYVDSILRIGPVRRATPAGLSSNRASASPTVESVMSWPPCSPRTVTRNATLPAESPGDGGEGASSGRVETEAMGRSVMRSDVLTMRSSASPNRLLWRRVGKRTIVVLCLTAVVTVVGASETHGDARSGHAMAAEGNSTLTDAFARIDVTEGLYAELAKDMDAAWKLMCAILVFLMQLGFCFLEAGAVRATSVQNIAFKNMIDFSLGAMCWWSVGWAFAFGDGAGSSAFIGVGDFFLSVDHGSDKIPRWCLSWVYMITSTTIISGAVAERISMRAYCVMVVLCGSLCYPIAVHWVWADAGWLSPAKSDRIVGNGALDFAGGCVIHMLGGSWALIAAYWVGPRQLPSGVSIFSAKGREMVAAHNKFQLAVGTLLLWFSWYAFNAGSVSSISRGGSEVAGHVMVVTTIGGATGVLTGAISTRVVYGYYHLGAVCNACLTGLVSVTAGCAYMDVWAAVVVAAVGALLHFAWLRLMERLHVDDVIDASAVHLVGGLWGTVAVGLFADQELVQKALGVDYVEHYGLFLGGGGEQLAAQLLMAAAVGAWTAAFATAACAVLRRTIGLRVALQAELQGLDECLHHAVCYDYLTQMQKKAQEAQRELNMAQRVADCLVAFDLVGAESVMDEHFNAAGGASALAEVFESLLANLRLYEPYIPRSLFCNTSDTGSSTSRDSSGPCPVLAVELSPSTRPEVDSAVTTEVLPTRSSTGTGSRSSAGSGTCPAPQLLQVPGAVLCPLTPPATGHSSATGNSCSASGTDGRTEDSPTAARRASNPLNLQHLLAGTDGRPPAGPSFGARLADSEQKSRLSRVTRRSVMNQDGSDSTSDEKAERWQLSAPPGQGLLKDKRKNQKLLQRLKEVNQLRVRNVSLLRASLQWSPEATWAEQLSADRYQVAWSEAYAELCELQIDAVNRHDGICLALSAGAIVSAWNATNSVYRHAKNACRCAIVSTQSARMAERLGRCVAHWAMSVSTGPVHVGFVGGTTSRLPCCVGEPQHTGRLVCDLAQQIRCRILALARVYDKVRHVVSARPVEAVSIGQSEVVYELIGELSDDDRIEPAFLQAFSNLVQREYETAASGFAAYVGNGNADDLQALRLLRMSLLLRQRPELVAPGSSVYSRQYIGWDDLDAMAAEAPVQDTLAEVLGRRVSPVEQVLGRSMSRRRSSFAASRLTRQETTEQPGLPPEKQEDLLRKQIEFHGAVGTAQDGLPKEFTDTSGVRWYLSAKRIGKGSFGSVWTGMGASGIIVAVKAIPFLQKPPESSQGTAVVATGDFFTPLCGFDAGFSSNAQLNSKSKSAAAPPRPSSSQPQEPAPELIMTGPQEGRAHSEGAPDEDELEISGWGDAPESPATRPLPSTSYRADSSGRDCSARTFNPGQAGPVTLSAEAQQQVEELLREVAMMSRLRHDNVVSYLGSGVCNGHVLIVMEYLSGGSLMSLLEQFGQIPLTSLRRFTKDILHGLTFLHGQEIVHRDLKPHNVLVTIEGLCKLADFGTSQEVSRLLGQEDMIAGTPQYMAPEACPGMSGAVAASDIWSFGVMFLQLLTGRLPWPGDLQGGLRFMVTLARNKDLQPTIPDGLPLDAATLARQTVRRDPAKRPKASALLHHDFVLT
eukprot:TRINITY_DN2513_c0_g1_i1.p1 TRINITY_DN2513_c0_g1~~TRINITY_DN2513_c0_g1_i1.p1  ORF type:complete len:2057 (+),score=452.05 TRINITY_DN2513_c0_g1_i1:66-6236(+)